MSSLPYQIFTVLADAAILIFISYYFFKFIGREKELDKKTGKMDNEYHKVVDDALNKERKILEDAADEAEGIIQNAEYVSTSSKDVVDKALQKMIDEIHNETLQAAKQFMESYSNSLGQISSQSQKDFQEVTKELTENLKNEVVDFQNSTKQFETDLKKELKQLLPGIEKELEEYKKMRIEQTEQTIAGIVQKASQEILNKSISLEDHENLIMESLEKAKREGVFD